VPGYTHRLQYGGDGLPVVRGSGAEHDEPQQRKSAGGGGRAGNPYQDTHVYHESPVARLLV
jgi:hypothetical protein